MEGPGVAVVRRLRRTSSGLSSKGSVMAAPATRYCLRVREAEGAEADSGTNWDEEDCSGACLGTSSALTGEAAREFEDSEDEGVDRWDDNASRY